MGCFVLIDGEGSAGGVDAIFGHLLVRREVVTVEFLFDALYLHIGRRVDAVFDGVPIEERSLEGLVFEVLDDNTSTEFPKSELVEVVSGVAVDKGLDMVVFVKVLDEESFFESPVGGLFFVVDEPVLADDFVADDARVRDEGRYADALEHRQRVAVDNGGCVVMVVRSAR